MSFNYRFEPPTINELDEISYCTYDKYCEGEFDCEICKYNKGDDTMDYVTKANLLDASIQNEFAPLNWADRTLYDDGIYMITFTGPTYSECCDEEGNLNHIKLLALQDGFFAKMHNIKRMIENCGIKVISLSKIKASKNNPFAEAIIEIDFEGIVGVEL